MNNEQLRQAIADLPAHQLPEALRLAEAAGYSLPSERSRDEDFAAELRERNDPENALYELFGILPLTRDQRRILELYLSESRMMAVGCNGSGKSFALAAIVLGLSWHLEGYRLAGDGRPQGCALLLIAPKEPQILDAYKAHFLHLAALAKERGHTIAGYGSHSAKSVSWEPVPGRWYMRAMTAPREAHGDAVSHFGLGPHHVNMVAWLEEVTGIYPPIIASLKGRLVSAGAKAVASTNPTSASGTGYNLSQRDGWPTAYSSAFSHPNVLERRTIYPGAVSVESVERDLRDPFLFEGRGQLWTENGDPPSGYAVPDPAKADQVYALAPVQTPEIGPREDGIPGHPEAEPQVFRPLVPEVFGRLIGRWPVVDPQVLFSDAAIEDAMRLGEGSGPEGPPRAVGIDGAMSTSGDRAEGVPWWGPPARTLWSVLAEAKSGDLRANIEQVIQLAEKSGLTIPAIAGMPHRFQHPESGERCAVEAIERWGKTPVYVIDPAWGGHIIEALRLKGCRVELGAFGAASLPALRGQRRQALNARAEWACTLSDVMQLGLVALPRVAEMAADLKTIGSPEEVERAKAGGKIVVVKLRPKDDMRDDLGRSPNAGDALLLASSSGPYMSQGVASWGRLEGWGG